MTKAEIMAQLDELGITYEKHAKVAELQEALEAAQKPDISDDATTPDETPNEPESVTCEVVRPFIDKYTKDTHRIGDVISVTPERFEEMNLGHERVKLV